MINSAEPAAALARVVQCAQQAQRTGGHREVRRRATLGGADCSRVPNAAQASHHNLLGSVRNNSAKPRPVDRLLAAATAVRTRAVLPSVSPLQDRGNSTASSTWGLGRTPFLRHRE